MANWKVILFHLLAKANFDLNAALIACVNFGPCPHPSQGISAAFNIIMDQNNQSDQGHANAFLSSHIHPVYSTGLSVLPSPVI